MRFVALAVVLLSLPAAASEPLSQGWPPQRTYGSVGKIPEQIWDTKLAPSEVHHVLTVHDGDTVTTREDGAIRFSGIDAPEIGGRARCPREDALAHAARDYVAMRLHDGVILRRRLGERDVEKYGRELRWVFAPDGGDVGEELIAKGWAVPYHGRGERMDWCRQ
jgi:endonuclease YncB( thermonuclease family)